MIPHRTRIKICGITRPEDAAAASWLGTDAIGLVFYKKSPRFVKTPKAIEIVKAIRPFTNTVGVFANPREVEVCSIINQVRLDVLQFHGEEPPEFCGAFGKPYFKTFRVGEIKTKAHFIEQMSVFARLYASAQGILLELYLEGAYGGQGQVFDWSILPNPFDKPLILAGGLTAQNVTLAIQLVKPYAVDVASGVESAPGIKDAALMRQFVESVSLCRTTT